MFETLVIDNVVDEQMQKTIHEDMMGADWHFLNDVSGVNSQYPSHGFSHVFVHPSRRFNKSSLYNIVEELYSKISHILPDRYPYYARSFLQLPLAKQYTKEHNGVHVDLPASIPHVACVYYVNGSDGDTIIYEQTINDVPGDSKNVKLVEHRRVTPKRGRIVLFDGSRYHCSSQPTVNYRCIINMDLVQNKGN